MSGCFADTEPERGRSGRRAASEKPDGLVWVGSDPSRQGGAVVRSSLYEVSPRSKDAASDRLNGQRQCQQYCGNRPLVVTLRACLNDSKVSESVSSRVGSDRQQPLQTCYSSSTFTV